MNAISRRLFFYIGTLGFCLNLHELIEIREQVAEQIDFSSVDQQQSIIGALPFRRTQVPVVDLASRLGISAVSPNTALILNSQEGNWALLVDQVEGIYADTDSLDLPLPLLLRAEGWRCFDHVVLHDESPFIRLDLLSCYAGGAG